MPRPKKNTPKGKIATEKWRKTMEEKYGDVSQKMASIGAKGGKACFTSKGFAANRELARMAGAVGGFKSRRGKSYLKELDSKREEMEQALSEGQSIADIARLVGKPYGAVRHYIRKNFEEANEA